MENNAENNAATEITLPKEQLQLSWLGTPLVSHAGNPVTFRTRKAFALLIYLTVEGGSHSREKLVALFWPESDSTRGRGMLRTTLAYLREALDPIDSTTFVPAPMAGTKGNNAYLDAGSLTVGFDFSRSFELDLHLLQAGLDLIQSQPEASTRHAYIRHLQKIVASQRGDFLEGFSLTDAPDFDDWVTLQREIWHRRMSRVFDTLTQWQFEAGEVSAALETAMRWKAHDPYSERAPQRLMQFHFANDNRAAALEVYAAYVKMLAAEFGGEPSPEMNDLAARIRTTSPVAPSRQAARPTLAAADFLFVGRGEEIARLQTAYKEASQGRTQIVVLVGEAGIGKTRLTNEFLHWASGQGADVLRGRSFETGGEVPYQPLAQLLRQRLDQEKSFADLLSRTWLAELSRLLPEVSDHVPGLPLPQPDEATAQSRLLESITRLGEALAERAPLLLFIDDLQWADRSSLDTLQYTMTKWTEQQAPILLLVCTREIVSTQKNNLHQWLISLTAKLTVTKLSLAPLTIEDTLRLLASLESAQSKTRPVATEAGGRKGSSGSPPASTSTLPRLKAFAHALFDETGGQPLYLVETVKALLEQKVLIPYQSEQGDRALQWRTLAGESTGQLPLPRIIPNSVRAAILDRLSRLTPAAMAMLMAAAVLGQAATFRQLVEISGVEQMAALDALEELVAKRLLQDANQQAQTYVITHDKIRDVIYSEISAARRQVLHSRAITAIQGSWNPLGSARLAYHALAAGMEVEAFQYSIMAGDAALHLFAAGDAIAHYETARKLLTAGGVLAVEDAQLQHLYLSLGRALDLTAHFGPAEAVYEELKTIAQQRAAPRLRLAALVAQVTPRSVLYHSYDSVQGEALAREALRLARELGDPVAEADILCRLTDLYRLSNRLPEAIVYGEQALALARELDLREQMAFILNAMVKCHAFNGRLDLAEQAQSESSELWRELNNLPMLADSLAGSAFLGRWSGKYDQALALSAEAYSISQSIANVWGQAYSLMAIGYIHWDRGDPAQAIAIMEESIRLAEKVTYLVPQVFTRADLGGMYASLGDKQRGFATMQQALELATSQLPTYRSYIIGLLARQYLWNNQFDEAADLIRQGRQEVNPQPFSFLLQWVFLAEAELAFRQQNAAHALLLTDEIYKAIMQSGMHSLQPAVLRLRGQCFIALGQQAEARAVLSEARAEAERLGSRRLLMQLLPLLATVETDPLHAEQLLRQAAEYKAYVVDHSPPEVRAKFLS